MEGTRPRVANRCHFDAFSSRGHATPFFSSSPYQLHPSGAWFHSWMGKLAKGKSIQRPNRFWLVEIRLTVWRNWSNWSMSLSVFEPVWEVHEFLWLELCSMRGRRSGEWDEKLCLAFENDEYRLYSIVVLHTVLLYWIQYCCIEFRKFWMI